jgi:hypothetical protein
VLWAAPVASRLILSVVEKRDNVKVTLYLPCLSVAAPLAAAQLLVVQPRSPYVRSANIITTALHFTLVGHKNS